MGLGRHLNENEGELRGTRSSRCTRVCRFTTCRRTGWHLNPYPKERPFNVAPLSVSSPRAAGPSIAFPRWGGGWRGSAWRSSLEARLALPDCLSHGSAPLGCAASRARLVGLRHPLQHLSTQPIVAVADSQVPKRHDAD